MDGHCKPVECCKTVECCRPAECVPACRQDNGFGMIILVVLLFIILCRDDCNSRGLFGGLF